jgi:hypothetical protein
MPQYVAIGTHDPSECPGASGRMREVWKKVLAEAPALREKHGIKLIVAPMHLDPTHMILAVIEAPSQDVVQDYLMEARLGQIQAMDLYRGTDLLGLFARADSGGFPPLY